MGVANTLDAFERVVGQNRSGTDIQIVYAPAGQKFAYVNGSTLVKYIDPMVAGMAAVHNGNGTGYFQHADWLGSSRFAQDGSGNVTYDRMYAPYDETASTNRDFTGQTEDTAPGLYDFLFRQQSQSQGRWLVPDPAGLAAVDITNPQTWNRYAYVGNNPLNATDPLGLILISGGDGCDPVLGCGTEGCGGIGWLCPIYPVIVIPCIDCGGVQPPPHQPPGNPPPSQQPINFPNETLGLPNGFPTNPWGIAGAIIPSGNCADMGPCNPIGSGFGPGEDILIGGLCAAQPEVCGAIILGGLTIYALQTYGPQIIQGLENATQNSPSGRQAKCTLYDYDRSLRLCTYICDDGQPEAVNPPGGDPTQCAEVIYRPWRGIP